MAPSDPVRIVDGNGNLITSTNPLPTSLAAGDLSIGNVDVDSVAIPSAIYNGQETVDLAGTAQAIGGSQALLSGITVRALVGNTGLVYVGNASVDSTNGHELAAGVSVFIEVDNVATIYVDAATNDDGVSWVGS